MDSNDWLRPIRAQPGGRRGDTPTQVFWLPQLGRGGMDATVSTTGF